MRAVMTVTRARVTSTGAVLRAGKPFTVTVFDYGNGTFELDDGTAFQSVNGETATRAHFQPGATFHAGKNDEYLMTVQAITGDWA